MKKILITGENSYIGSSVTKWLSQWPKDYDINTIDMIDGLWRTKSFSNYDVVFHVAGIAHVDSLKITKKSNKLYYDVNTNLTIEVAKKAKLDGVKQFIFMSSSIVYGKSMPIGKEKIINKDTVPVPTNTYGNSKLMAEKGLQSLNCSTFKIVILRPPMIYGKGCKGNYLLLAKYASKFLIFPNVNNKRSILYIDNLCEFVRLMIINNESGIFFPQNDKYVKTAELVGLIAKAHGRKLLLTKIFNFSFNIMNNELINKVFGNFVYDMSISIYEKGNYRVKSFEESIIQTES